MSVHMKLFLWACGGVIVGCVLAILWWWIKIELRYWILSRLARRMNQIADQIEALLERMYALADEAEQIAWLMEAECNRLQPPRQP